MLFWYKWSSTLYISQCTICNAYGSDYMSWFSFFGLQYESSVEYESQESRVKYESLESRVKYECMESIVSESTCNWVCCNKGISLPVTMQLERLWNLFHFSSISSVVLNVQYMGNKKGFLHHANNRHSKYS